MRSKERLIEVMRSVNPHMYPGTSEALRNVADHIELAVPIALCHECAQNVRWLATEHSSPHIQDLARDALAHCGEKVP